MARFREQPTPEYARTVSLGVATSISPSERLQFLFHPWTSFVIVPLFALANTGVHVDGDVLHTPRGRESRPASPPGSWSASPSASAA
jgi:hypothetical protein